MLGLMSTQSEKRGKITNCNFMLTGWGPKAILEADILLVETTDITQVSSKGQVWGHSQDQVHNCCNFVFVESITSDEALPGEE